MGLMRPVLFNASARRFNSRMVPEGRFSYLAFRTAEPFRSASSGDRFARYRFAQIIWQQATWLAGIGPDRVQRGYKCDRGFILPGFMPPCLGVVKLSGFSLLLFNNSSSQLL
jgi:hypothetical protein